MEVDVLTGLALTVSSAFVAATLGAAAGADDPLFQVRVDRVRHAFAVARAVHGAARRLGDPRCREVLASFRRADGSLLTEALFRGRCDGGGPPAPHPLLFGRAPAPVAP
jgi:hypothetical protein